MSHTLPHRPSPGGQPPVGQPGYHTGFPPPGSAVSAAQSSGYVPQVPPGTNYPPIPPPSSGPQYDPRYNPPPSTQQAYPPQQPQSFAPPPTRPEAGLSQSPVSFRQGMRSTQSTAESAVREYVALQHRRKAGEGVEDQLRLQARAAARELGSLRRDVLAFAKNAERHRWRRWLIGGIM